MSIKRLLIPSLLAAGSTPVWAHVNLVKVCNYRSATIWAAYKQDVSVSSIPEYELSGWFRYDPNQCRDVLGNYKGFFWITAQDKNGWKSQDAFYTDNFLQSATLCVRTAAHTHIPAGFCDDGIASYRMVSGHRFNFAHYDFNVYEIDFH